VKPSGGIRLCIDLTKLNNGIEREQYQLESVDETIARIGDECHIMTKLDANSGYWQMKLDQQSQLLTTFITPLGRFCCTRGPFGLSSMQEIFNKRIDSVIDGLPGVAKSTDDFLVYAKTESEHDIRLERLLQRFEENGVTLNKGKCVFKTKQVEFLGHDISPEGITPHSSKVSAISDYPTPTNLKELRRFMGMAQQLSKFTDQLAEAAEPLRELLSTKTTWMWTIEHDIAFKKVKDILINHTTLHLYNTNKPTKLRTDGSKLNGISVILYQQHDEKWVPISCASRFLSIHEKNYHPIEIEMLAVSWGCRKMHMYLHGLPHFKIQTDHKPLIPILNSKMLVDLSPRIQRMKMTLLPYTFTAEHVKGIDLKDADALSRAPTEQPNQQDQLAEQEIMHQVSAVIQSMPTTSRKLEEIRQQSETDTELITLRKVMNNGWPNSMQECPLEVRPFYTSRHDITDLDGVLCKGNRIIIPRTMRSDVLQRIHAGHQGIEKCKRRARNSCYWPRMNQQIENIVKKCTICAKFAPSKPAEVLKPHAVPTQPWQKIGTDIFQTNGNNYIVVTDYYSLWPEVYHLQRISSENVIVVIKDIFSRHGIPEELVSDNGTQYKSSIFKKFATDWGFKHTTSSPRYPQSNGLSESAVKVTKVMIKKQLCSKRDIAEGLLIIRNTPLQCGYSPAQLMMGRQLRDNLPSMPHPSTQTPNRRDIVTERMKQKEHYDHSKARRCPTQFTKGQQVRIQHHVTKEWSIEGTIIQEVAPRSYNVQTSEGRILRRNTKDIRKIYSLTSSLEPNRDIYQIDNAPGENDTETINKDSDSETLTADSDSDTIPYRGDDSDSNTTPVQEKNSKARYTRSGRRIQHRHPLDYCDL